MAKRGYGVSALIAPGSVPVLAKAAEEAGFQTFWVNDVQGANGLEQLAQAQEATSTIRLGVGVLPVDRWSVEEIASTVGRLDLNTDRLLIGIGAGAYYKDSLQLTGDTALALAEKTSARIMIGALGPKMCWLAGSHANGVLLNWCTPRAARELAELTREGASEAKRPQPEIITYVRTSASPDAQRRLENEANSYQSYPAYSRHFERMGVHAIETTVNGTQEEIARRFAEFDSSDEIVARAIAATDRIDDYLAVLRAAAPESQV